MLFKIFNWCISFFLAALAQTWAVDYAREFRNGVEAVGGEVFVFPMVLFASYKLIEMIQRAVENREYRKGDVGFQEIIRR